MAKHATPKPAVPVEHKVTATTAVGAALGIVIAVLNGLSDGSVLSALHIPEVYQGIILAVIPPVVVLVSGYLAPHTERPDVMPMEDSNSVDWANGKPYSSPLPDAKSAGPECGH